MWEDSINLYDQQMSEESYFNAQKLFMDSSQSNKYQQQPHIQQFKHAQQPNINPNQQNNDQYKKIAKPNVKRPSPRSKYKKQNKLNKNDFIYDLDRNGDPLFELIQHCHKCLKTFEKYISKTVKSVHHDPVVCQKSYKKLHFSRMDRIFRRMKINIFCEKLIVILDDLKQQNIKICDWLERLIKNQNKIKFISSDQQTQLFKVQVYTKISNKAKSISRQYKTENSVIQKKFWYIHLFTKIFPNFIYIQPQIHKNQQDPPTLQNSLNSSNIKIQIPQPVRIGKSIKNRTNKLIQQQKQKLDKFSLKQKQKYKKLIQQIKKVKQSSKRIQKRMIGIVGQDSDDKILIKFKEIEQQGCQNVKKEQQDREFEQQQIILRIKEPRCPDRTCKNILQSLKCVYGNHIIVICPRCSWNQHNCTQQVSITVKQYFQCFQIITISNPLKNYLLPRLNPLKHTNNIREVIQSKGYTFIQTNYVHPLTPLKFQCHYPILPNSAAQSIWANRQEQLNLPLVIQQSSIKGAGLGVFTTVAIPNSGTLICSYLGDVGVGGCMRLDKELKGVTQTNDSIYTLGWLNGKDILVICPDKFTNVGRFINYNEQKKCNLKPTIALLQAKGSKKYQIAVILTSICPIRAHQQLFYNYGPDFTQDFQ